MRKYLKKGDIVVLICIVILSILLFFLAFSDINIESNKAQVLLNNEVLYTFDINNDAIFDIYTDEENSKLYIKKNDVIVKSVTYNKVKHIHNKFEIIDGKINMIEANCENKDCMRVTLDKDHVLPIICTNGITIKLVNNDFDIDVIS